MITVLLPRPSVDPKNIRCFETATEADRNKMVDKFYIKVDAKNLYGSYKVFEMLEMEQLAKLFVLQKDLEHTSQTKVKAVRLGK